EQLRAKENEVMEISQQLAKLNNHMKSVQKSFEEKAMAKDKQIKALEQQIETLKEQKENESKSIINLNFIPSLSSSSSSLSLSPFTNLQSMELFHSAKQVKTLVGHKGIISSVQFCPFDDGRTICSASLDQSIRLWDVQTAKQLQLFKGKSAFTCAQFSPLHCGRNDEKESKHGPAICSASRNGCIYFCDIQTGKFESIFAGHKDSVTSVHFSPFKGGRILCSGSWDETICLWDASKAQILHTLKGHEGGVNCVQFSPLSNGCAGKCIVNNKDSDSDVVDIGGAGYTICSGADDNVVRLWDVDTLKELTVFKGHKDAVFDVRYSPFAVCFGGGCLICSAGDKTVRLWDTRISQQVQLFQEHSGSVRCALFAPFRSAESNATASGNSTASTQHVVDGRQSGAVIGWNLHSIESNTDANSNVKRHFDHVFFGR
ncbi:G-protein beta WD-40 repeats containing protein, partial [Reticulomyxa filosa]